jgi:hypothetical protein
LPHRMATSSSTGRTRPSATRSSTWRRSWCGRGISIFVAASSPPTSPRGTGLRAAHSSMKPPDSR